MDEYSRLNVKELIGKLQSVVTDPTILQAFRGKLSLEILKNLLVIIAL